ncbi:MAG: radical SAM protein [Nanoarchaeota archaeon]
MPISEIDGIAFKDNNKTRINQKKSFVHDLDELPFPSRELWDYEKYFKTGTTEIGIIATRGCPYNCLYCKPMVDKLFGNRVRKRSAKNVVEEIEEIVKRYSHLFKGMVKLWFKDDTLTLCGLEWFKEFKNELEKRKLSIDWGCHTRIDNVDFDLLKTMKESGLSHISFGVESGSQKILNYYRKGTTPEQAVKAFNLCKDLKIKTFAYFMIGAPIETKEDLEDTYQLIKKIKPDGLDVFTAVPYPGNDLYDLLKKNNQLIEGDIDYYAKHSLIKLEHITDKDLKHYRKKIYSLNNRQLMLRYFTSFGEFKKLVKYILKRPGFVINYLKRSL